MRHTTTATRRPPRPNRAGSSTVAQIVDCGILDWRRRAQVRVGARVQPGRVRAVECRLSELGCTNTAGSQASYYTPQERA